MITKRKLRNGKSQETNKKTLLHPNDAKAFTFSNTDNNRKDNTDMDMDMGMAGNMDSTGDQNLPLKLHQANHRLNLLRMDPQNQTQMDDEIRNRSVAIRLLLSPLCYA